MGFDAGIRLGGVDEKSPPLSPNQPCWAAPAVLSGDLWPRYAKFLWMTSRSWEKLPVKRDRAAAGRDSHTACIRSSGYARWTWSPTYSHSPAGYTLLNGPERCIAGYFPNIIVRMAMINRRLSTQIENVILNVPSSITYVWKPPPPFFFWKCWTEACRLLRRYYGKTCSVQQNDTQPIFFLNQRCFERHSEVSCMLVRLNWVDLHPSSPIFSFSVSSLCQTFNKKDK